MIIVAVAWMYVVVLMALAEGTADNGSWLGATFTFLLYGALPLAIVLYLFATPARRRARSATEAAEIAAATKPATTATTASASGLDPDGGGHPAADAVAAERKEP